MAKKWILRSDGILQRYNIKNIKRYSKTGQKIKGANIYRATIPKAKAPATSRIAKKRIVKPKAQPKIYYVNFEIADTRGYVVGSLSSPHFIAVGDAIKIITKILSEEFKNYIPINYYEADETGKQNYTELVLLREENKFFSRIIK